MKGRLSVILFAIVATAPAAWSQRSDEQLIRISEKARTEHLTAHQRVVEYTSARNTPSFFTTPSGARVLITGVREDGTPEYRITLNAGSALSTGAALLHQPANLGVQLEGEGLTIAIWDAGRVEQHSEFGNRLAVTDGDKPDGHATHVAGTLIAAGVNPSAKGMAPKARASTYFFANDLSVIAGLASVQLISNHSYGAATGWFNAGPQWLWTGNPDISTTEDFRFGFYGPRAQTQDDIAFNSPYYSIFWAAGNDRSDTGDGSRPSDCNSGTGFDCIIPDAVAKNIFTIGAISKVPNYQSPSSVAISNYSSWGPTDDGRIKPDLVAPGNELLSTSAAGSNLYELSSGTSMASPSAAGSLALVQELHARLYSGRFMKAATLKALAIHTARECGSFPGPDYTYGWGLVDARAAARLLLDVNHNNIRVDEYTLTNGGVMTIPVTTVPGKKITATIVWTDPPGKPVPNTLDPVSLMLVNDLDMRIIGAGSEQAPWMLDPLNPSRQAVRGDNFRDNVEKIEFTSTASQYTLRVSHKGQLLNGKQDFSLVLSYESPAAPKVLYWVGNSGDWNDANHWSLTSGGPPANVIPSPSDIVVIDENSFSAGGAAVSLGADAHASRLRWTSSKGLLDLNSHTLTLTSTLTMAAAHHTITDGTVRLGGDGGTANFSGHSFLEATLEVAGGNWTIDGDTHLSELLITGGELDVHSALLDVDAMTATPASSARLLFNKATIVVHERLVFDATKVQLADHQARLVFPSAGNDAISTGFNWSGVMQVDQGSLALHGNNTIHHLVVDGDVRMEGSNHIERLELLKASSVALASGSILEVDSMSIITSPQTPVVISSEGLATIRIPVRQKICLDYLDVRNVAVQGDAVVNAGLSSTLVNAPGWQQEVCNSVLFANFTVDYACAYGVATFTEASSGTPDSWAWRIEAPGGNITVGSGREFRVSLGGEGEYRLTLNVSKGSVQHVANATITVPGNPIEAFDVALNSERLFAGIPGDGYQWYFNGERMPDAQQRALPFDGAPGNYFAVVFRGSCNRVSNVYTISGAEAELRTPSFYPNPADDELYVGSYQAGDNIIAMNVLGTAVSVVVTKEGRVDTSALPPGVYLFRVTRDHITTTSRVVVTHRQ